MQNKKELLYSEEAEEAVLYVMMTDPTHIDKIFNYLSPSDFFNQKNAIVYKSIVELWEITDKIDLLTINEKLEATGDIEKIGGMERLTEICGIDFHVSSAHIIKYSKIIKEYSIRRKLQFLGSSIKLKSESRNYQLPDVFSHIDSAYHEIHKDFNNSFEERGLEFDEAMERVLDRRSPSAKGLKTGIDMLDDNTFGLKRGHYWALYAYTGVGKTWTSLTMAHAALKQDANVKFLSLEMSQEEIWDRVISIEQKGDRKDSTAYDRVSKFKFQVEDKIKEIGGIRRYVKQHAKSTDVFFIDYLGLIRDHKNRDEMSRLIEISDELAFLAKNYNVCIVTLAQCNQMALTAGDLEVCIRGGAQVIAPCDVVVRIKRINEDEKDANGRNTYIKYILQKNRHGKGSQMEEVPVHPLTGIIETKPITVDNLTIDVDE